MQERRGRYPIDSYEHRDACESPRKPLRANRQPGRTPDPAYGKAGADRRATAAAAAPSMCSTVTAEQTRGFIRASTRALMA